MWHAGSSSLTNVNLNGASRTQAICYMIPFKGNIPPKIKSIDTESRLVIAWGGGCEWESTANETEGLVVTMEMFKKLDCDDGCTTL